MEINCSKKEMLQLLSIIEKAVPTNNPLEVLAGIKFSANYAGKLTAIATDLGLSIKTETKIEEVLEEGQVVIPAKYIIDLFRKLPDQNINIRTSESQCIIQYGKSEATINTFALENFPEIVFDTADTQVISVNADKLKNAVRKLSHAASKDSTRPIFTGIHFEIEGKFLTMAATDTFRLVQQKIPLSKTIKNMAFIVPVKTLSEVSRITSNDIEEIKVSVSNNKIFFSITDTIISSSLIPGTFPQYKNVIPQNCAAYLSTQTKYLTDAIDRAYLLSSKTANTTKLSLNGKFTVAAKDSSGNSLHEELEAEISGQPMEITVNSRFLLDILKSLGSEKVTVELTGNSSPVLFKTADTNYLSLLVPLRQIS